MSNPGPNKYLLCDDEIHQSNYFEFIKDKPSFLDYLKRGYSGASIFARLRNPEFIHNLYIQKKPWYMAYLNNFLEKYQGFDVIVMNPGVDLVHPEFLNMHFKNSLKILHFIDDPHTTYSYGLPFAWVFDGATYISPSYSADFSMEQLLKLAGFSYLRWVPHCVTNLDSPQWTLDNLEAQLRTRNKRAVYVGGFYTGKIDRLIGLKKALGSRLDVFGRFPLRGLSFPLWSFLSGAPLMYRVRSLSNFEREAVYQTYGVGINMHLSSPSIETGNARLYELAYRGVAQVVDTSNISGVAQIFEPEKEILTYESDEECISQVNRLLDDDDLRIKIAKAAYERAISEYSYDEVFANLVSWFKSVDLDRKRSNAFKH